MFGQINMMDEEGNAVELYVIEQTRVNNTDYLLVTDSQDEEEGEVNAFIVKDLSEPDAQEAVYVTVEEDDEFEAVARIFNELVGDLD